MALKLSYFGIEFAVALAISSVSLFADSIDFLQDAAISLLVMLGLGWSLRQRSRLGMALAGGLLIPAFATFSTAWEKLMAPVALAPMALSLAGTGALAVNIACTLLLARYRAKGCSLPRAAFLSVRNDVLANIAIIAAGVVTAHLWPSAWPDLIVGLGIAAMNVTQPARFGRSHAKRTVWLPRNGRSERVATVCSHSSATSPPRPPAR